MLLKKCETERRIHRCVFAIISRKIDTRTVNVKYNVVSLAKVNSSSFNQSFTITNRIEPIMTINFKNNHLHENKLIYLMMAALSSILRV